jgi:hypothetical protein
MNKEAEVSAGNMMLSPDDINLASFTSRWELKKDLLKHLTDDILGQMKLQRESFKV